MSVTAKATDHRPTSDALELAEARFRTLVERLPAIVWTATLDNRVTYVSPQVERILGTPVETWLGDPDAWARQIHPEDRERVLATMADAKQRGVTYRCEYRFLRADGGVVWVLDEAVLVHDAEGRPVAIQGLALDITERKHAEEEAAARARELETLHRISAIVRTGRPLDDIYPEITAAVEAAIGFVQAAIVLYDEARDRLVYKGTRGVPENADGRDFETGLDDTFSGVVVRTGRPLVWSEGQPLPSPAPRSAVSAETRTFVGVPMTVGDRVIGVLSIGDRTPHAVEPRLVLLVASIANHVAALIERARTREALEASERHFHAAFDTAHDAMLVVDDARHYVAANPAAARLLGVPIERLLALRLGDATGPPFNLERGWPAVLGGQLTSGECHLARPDGEVRDVEYSITVNFVPGRHLAVLRDVTERKRENEVRRVRAAALTAAASGIVITDAEGKVEWANPEFSRMSGYTTEELRGQTLGLLRSGQHAPAFYAELWRTIRAGDVWRGELVNCRKDGTLYHEEQSITPVRRHGTLDGPITHYVAVKQDVSERKRADEVLRRSEAYHRSLIEHGQDLIIVLNGEAIVRYASPSVERILGYRPEEMVGTSTLDRLHPDDRERIAALLRTGRETPGFTTAVEYRVRHRDGSYRTFESVACNLLDHHAVAGVIVNARDVTERREGERMQERLKEHLRHSEKLAAMSELLAGVAHELNNPLSVVIGHTALLARTADAAVAGRAEKIGQAAERCGRIVRNFLSLARQYPPERTTVSLNRLVQDALEMLAYPLRVDTVEVVTELAPDLPTLAADGHQLQQVVVNLVTNAHQAMRSGAGPRRLTLRTGRESTGAVWLEVSDSGPGIPPEVEARLFEPFFTTKPVGQGTGLGLSICKGIVEGHQGRILVDGGPGRGATFRVELPRGDAMTAPAASDSGPVASHLAILVVDDEAEVGAVMSELLRRDGHEVDAVANGLEALARLRTRTYDIVISDIKMPQLDGLGLWTAVKQRDPEMAARFVFFTGDTLSSATAEFLERTGAPSIKKPFALRDVRLALARVAGIRLADDA